MKKQHFKLVLLLVLAFLTTTSLPAQNVLDATSTIESESEVLFGNLMIEDLKEVGSLYTLEDEVITVDRYENAQDPATAVALARTMLALGVGFAFGNDQTLWCFHAAYYLTLATLASSTLYAVLGGTYNGLSYSDSDFKSNIFDLSLKLLMFTSISQYMGWNLIYGIALAYGFGNEDNGFSKIDLTRITAAFVVGFHLMLTSALALAVTTDLFAYQETTFKPEGDESNEYKVDSTRFILNKASIFAISLLITL